LERGWHPAALRSSTAPTRQPRVPRALPHSSARVRGSSSRTMSRRRRPTDPLGSEWVAEAERRRRAARGTGPVKSTRRRAKSLWPGVALAAGGASFLVAARRKANVEPLPLTDDVRSVDLPERRRLDERRRATDRRVHDIDGVVGRVLRGSERRQVPDRRSGNDRRARTRATGGPR
jgi:hypothetical protein